MGARGWLILLVALTAVVLLVGRTATALFVDHAWFEAMGAPSLFWEQVVDTVLLQGGAWVVGSLFAFANLHAVRRTILAVAVPSRVANIELTAMVPGRRLLSATVVLSLVVGAVLALPLTNWETVALVRHGIPFGEIDGIFDRDLGHFVYWLPFEETLYLWALVSLVAMTAMVLVLYALTRSLRLEGRRIAASTHVRRHLSVLGALVLLLLAWSYRLDGFDLLLAGSGPDGMFLRVDHRVTLRMDYVMAYGAAIAALVILRTGWAGQLRAAFVTLTVVLVAALGLRHGVPYIVSRGDTLGDPARRDADYVAARALYSRRAFDVDEVRVAGDSTRVTPLPVPTATLAARASLWDAFSLAEGLGQGDGGASAERNEQRARAGSRSSDFTGAQGSQRAGDRDAGRTAVRGSREGDDGARLIDVSAPGWTMTGGRVTAVRVERPVSSGSGWRISLLDATQPVARDSVIELARSEEIAGVPWPLVAPGLSGARLLDASTAADVPGALLDTDQARIAHAWALRDLALLKVDTEEGTPLLVTHRDVRDRVQQLAPVFEQGTTVYPLLDGGQLYWVLHLYSASDRYPFSQRWQVGDGVFTYFKLAATAIVDAGTGRVRLVPVAKPDPIARTWMTRWPRLFTPASALAPSLAAQLPPATDGAALQVRTFAEYGSRQDGPVRRHLPDSAFLGGSPAIVQLAHGASDVSAWSLPLLDDHDGIAGVVTAVGGVDRHVYWSAARTADQTWPTVLAQLRAVADSAVGGGREADAERRGDSSVARPPVRARLGRPEALVTSRGLLFLQAAQGLTADGRLEWRTVALTDGRRRAAGPTLADALTSLGEVVQRPDGVPAATPDAHGTGDRDAPRRWYQAMRQALRQGNWSAFGAAFDSLGRVLDRPPQ